MKHTEQNIAELNKKHNEMPELKTDISKEFSYKNAIIFFRVSAFNGNLRDLRLTNEAIEKHGVTGRKLSLRKYILGGEILNELTTCIQSSRSYFNSKTLPWSENGARILPSTQLMDLKSEMEQRIRTIMEKVDKLVLSLPELIEKDKEALKDTWCASDYPSANELRSKFSARVEVWPISMDFRVEGIEAAHSKIIQREIEENVAKTIKEAKVYQLEQLITAITHLNTKLSDPEKSFKSGSLENILDANADIVNLSLDHDPVMIKIADSIKTDFNKINIDTLREDKNVRQETVQMMEAKLKEIKSLMEGFV